MKRARGLVLVLCLITSLSWSFRPVQTAWAADPATQDIIYTGEKPEASADLKIEEMETKYEDRQVPDTCTRQVPDGQHQECEDITRRECEDVRQWECHDTTRQECRDTTRRECQSVSRRECEDTTRRECTSVSRRECSTEYRDECSSTTRRECSGTTRRECSTEYRDECRTTTRRECESTTRRECSGGGMECHDVPDEVCFTDPQGQQQCRQTMRRVCEQTQPDCRDVPDTVCHDVPDQVCRQVPYQDCRDVPDTVCRDVPDQVCRQVPYQDCRDVPDSVCRDVPDTVCRDVPDTVCRDVPDTVCRSVPDRQCGYETETVCHDVPDQVCHMETTYRTETYACTKTIQVPVGQQLKLQTLGAVKVHFAGLPAGEKADEDFRVQLVGTDVNFSLVKASGRYLIYVAKKQNVKVVDDRHRVVNADFTVTLVPLASLKSMLDGGVRFPTLTARGVSFTLGKVTKKELLEIGLSVKRAADGAQLFNAVVDADDLVYKDRTDGTGTDVTIDLAAIGLQAPLSPGQYQLTLSAGFAKKVAQGLLNQSLLDSIRPVQASVDQLVSFADPSVTAATIANMVLAGIKDVKLSQDELSFTVGKIVAREYLSASLNLERQRFTAGPVTVASGKLFDGSTAQLPKYLKLADEGDRTRVRVLLAQLRLRENLQPAIYRVALTLALEKKKLKGLIPDQVLTQAVDANYDEVIRDLAPKADAILNMVNAGITDVEINSTNLKFKLGRVVYPNGLGLNLRIRKDGIFSDKEIFSDNLEIGSNTRFVDVGDRSQAVVDLSQLNLVEDIKKGGKYIINVQATLQRDELDGLLTADQLDSAKEAKIEAKVKALANP